MSLLLSLRKRLIFPVLLAAFPTLISGQITSIPEGNETLLSGALNGDQVYPSLSLNQNGGYVVWEENGSAKTGSEIRAAKLNSSFAKTSTFAVNKVVKGDQRKPQVQILSNGNTIFVWESFGLGNADIYARILKADDTFATADIRINSFSKAKNSPSKDQQSEPVVTALQDGGAMVVWQSYNQDGEMMGVYARKISTTGTLEGDEFLVNVTTSYNQRSPAVATLANGNVVILWISELQRFGSGSFPDQASVDVYARLFSSSGQPLSDELLLNSGNNVCANPSVAPLLTGGFTAVWSEKDSLNRSNSWDVAGRSFNPEGLGAGADFKINSTTFGDQFRPKIAPVGNDGVVVWTSLGQDGSREGVFGRLLQNGAEPVGSEFRANTRTVSKQMFPAVAASGSDRFLVGWSGFVAISGFDLFGQKYILNQPQ